MLVVLALFFVFLLVWYYWQNVNYLIVNKRSAGINNDDEEEGADYEDTIRRSLIMKKLNSSEQTRHLRGSYLVQSETSDLISLFGSSWLQSRDGSSSENNNVIDQRFQSFHSCSFSTAGVNLL